MQTNCILCVLVFLLVNVLVGAKVYNRYDFPPGFVFGAGTSAYQLEGAVLEDGRKASIFDAFAHSSGKKGNGDVAAGGYHKYKEDVKLMAETGLDAYRFSISWSRLIPDGRGPVNSKGLEYYNNLINELLNHGIQPHATLMHFDLPLALEDKYEGILSLHFVEDFTAYADVCFREFGDRVLHWTTINEPNIFMMGGYDVGNAPPGRCSSPFGLNCTQGNSTTEPYIVAHNILLAHASVYSLYKEKYQDKQHGFIGFNLYAFGFIPSTNTKEDESAANRAYDFFIGLFMHPLSYGDYPEIMKINVGSRLPAFTETQSKLVKGSFDFIGLNYYTVVLIKDKDLVPEPRDFLSDMAAVWIYYSDSSPLEGNPYPTLPWGLQGVLEHFKNIYNNPPIYIHENGQLTYHNASLNDSARVDYLQGLIEGVLDSVRNGSNAKGYFVWSFIDMYELVFGYEICFGLYYVDFDDQNLSRSPKMSQSWYSGFLNGTDVVRDDNNNQAKLSGHTRNYPWILDVMPLKNMNVDDRTSKQFNPKSDLSST